MRCKHRLVVSLSVASSMLMAASPSFAQLRAEDPAVWPTRPVKLVVPTAPGQASDALARLLADYFSKAFGKSFVVDNRPGAGGSIGLGAVAAAAPDGYTLVIGSSGPLTMSPAIYPKLSFDPIKDFEPIANIALTPQLIAVSSSGPYKTLADLTAAAKQRYLPFAIPSLGSTAHFAYAAFTRSAKVEFNLIPFRGNAQGASQVMAGDVAAMYDTVPGALSLIKAGKLRAIAVAGTQRSPFLPDTPTFAEQGVAGADVIGWIGLAAPAKTPSLILDKLNAQVRLFLESAAIQESLKNMAFVPVADSSRSAFAKTIQSETSRWAKLAKDANIRAE
ncbi:tripartite tricarboxylate transporter substrate binding protein [Hydrogenophaga sp. 2FB]|uniref:Bug family tripartite tricarboxylate transporter substrate binding protein n=1 Tax=Hydrogenophaga sp. 2FB TaxID=2502187 RepID=UPI0010F7D001|nr:tripartite tricarboxylate transporter substrate binding protein [Hydrogenophaga sp. 2FB]